MITKQQIIIVFYLVFFGFISAQQSHIGSSSLSDFTKALALYNQQQYLSAQNTFKTIKAKTTDSTIVADCAYYIANSAIRLNQSNAETLIVDFVTDYPLSLKRNRAYLDVADYYFNNAKYAHAQKWYDKIDENTLDINSRERFYFNAGYAAFINKQKAKAKTYLSRLENSKTYGSQAKYYIGYMAYEGDDYDKANQYFNQLSSQEAYKEKLSYYQADLNFKLGNFEKAISLAKPQLPKSTPAEVSELNKIIGESYFNLKQYAESIPYLQAYKGKQGKWSNTDYYQLGYAYYKQQDYDKAISEFNKIISGNDAVAQNAYYHLGESYIYLGKKQAALNAFRNASQMDFDLKIKEDAWLNYAKLSYDIGNPYESVPQALTNYLEAYSNSSHKALINNLLIDAYITSKNFEDALTLLEKNKSSLEHKKAYQKVAFYRGLEVFNTGDYKAAKAFFEKSLTVPQDPIYVARATFWKAESAYNLNDFVEAKTGFNIFQQNPAAPQTPEYNTFNYNLAYTYFKLKDYKSAINHFNNYINTTNNNALKVTDAYIRLADCYFASSDYKKAIIAYDNAIKMDYKGADYPAFQKAISYGYIGEDTQKIAALENFITQYPESKRLDEALFELGNAYIKLNNNKKGISMYERLSTNYPQSLLASKALLREGLIYYNTNRGETALNKFKTVVANYPGTPEAIQAVSTARLIYVDLGQVEAYANWVKTLDFVEVTNADLDHTTYQAAEKQYLDNNTQMAIKQFKDYLNQFPGGLHAVQVHFYLAQLYNKNGENKSAVPHYQEIINRVPNEFYEEALLKLTQIQLDNAQWETAIPLLKRLETAATFAQNIVFSQSNLMQAYYQLKDFKQAEIYAEKVLAQNAIGNAVKSDAQVIIARSALHNGNTEKALAAYAEVEKTATGNIAAEALYYNAFFKNQAGNYEASNEIIQKLIKNHSANKEFSAKALIIMAKNYNALDDAFQATYILKSIIEKFKEFPDIISEAETTLETINTQQAKTNSSVEKRSN